MATFYSVFLLAGLFATNAFAEICLRAIEAGAGKRVGEKLTGGFVLCPAEFGPLSIECLVPGAKYVDIFVGEKRTRTEWNAPYTLMGDFPQNVVPWKPATGGVTLKCTAFFKSKTGTISVKSVSVSGTVGCPKSFLGYRKTSKNIYAIMQKALPSPTPSPSKKPAYKAKKIPSPSPSPKKTAQMSYPMKLRLVNAGMKGADRTIANLVTGFFLSLKNKYKDGVSVVCDAPKTAKYVTFYINGKKGKTESERPFSIAGDRGTTLLKWTGYGHGRANITCVCNNGNKVMAIGFIYLLKKK